jgi:hypothetical protein
LAAAKYKTIAGPLVHFKVILSNSTFIWAALPGVACLQGCQM